MPVNRFLNVAADSHAPVHPNHKPKTSSQHLRQKLVMPHFCHFFVSNCIKNGQKEMQDRSRTAHRPTIGELGEDGYRTKTADQNQWFFCNFASNRLI